MTAGEAPGMGIGPGQAHAMRTHGPVLLLVAVVACGIYLNAIGNDFIWDDHYIIVENTQIRDLRRAATTFGLRYWRHVRETGSLMAFRDYRPVAEFSFAADYAIAGAKPSVYHVSNILIHAANSVLVYFFACRLFGSRRAGAFCALLFAAHPIHVEAVVWAKARPALFALFFGLGSMLLYLCWAEQPLTRRGAALYAVSLVMFALALGSKATAAVVPLLLGVYLWCFPVRSRRRAVIALLPFVGMGAALFAIAAALSGEVGEEFLVTPYSRFLGVLGTVGVYLRLLVLPVGLCVHHDFPFVTSLRDPVVLRALPWELPALAGLVVSFRRSPIAFFALAWVLIGLVPVSNLRILTRPIGELRAYGPSLGYCLLVTLALLRLPLLSADPAARRRLRQLSVALCAFLVALYSGSVMVRNADWATSLRLMQDTVAKNPDSIYARVTLAQLHEAHGRYDLVIEQLERTLEIAPGHVPSLRTLSRLCRDLGKYDEAIEYYRRLMALVPSEPRLHIGLGMVYAEKGWRGRAIVEFEKALALDPRSHEARANLGMVHIANGDYRKAAAELEEAVRLAPDDAMAHQHLGLAYEKLGRHDLAAREYGEAQRRAAGAGAPARPWLPASPASPQAAKDG